jgi:serine/threonine-protein kinase
VISLALFVYLRRANRTHEQAQNLSFGYEVVLALGIGIVNQWTPNIHGLSWIAALILIHPLIVPGPPGKTVLASVAAASMDPFGLFISGLRGVPMPPLSTLIWANLPTYICAGLAVIPAHLIARLRRQVDDARELGSYRLGELLGSGGMADVYRAEHLLLARPAAIKVIRPGLLNRLDVRERQRIIERFEREARAVAMLRCPHTVALYDFGVTEGGMLYHVMELLEGVNLNTLVDRWGPTRPERAVYLLTQVCESLAEAHDVGLIHRDIKPANLQVCRSHRQPDVVKVLDFGLVRPVDLDESMPSLTVDRAITGTPAYMAPEQVVDPRSVDGRTDIYALGCVAYWLLTGRKVFEGRTAVEVLTHHLRTDPVPPSQIAEEPISNRLDEITLGCLEKDPANRPASAGELASLLEGSVEGDPWTAKQARRWWEMHEPDGS